jgi:hypothetical protein
MFRVYCMYVCNYHNKILCILMYANSKILKSNRNKKCTDMFLHCSLTHCDLIFLLQQNTRDWVVYKQQKFISHSSRGWKSEVEVEVEHGQVLVPS